MATSWISTRQVISLRLPYDHHDQVTCQKWIRQDQLNRQLLMAAKEFIHLVDTEDTYTYIYIYVCTWSPDVSTGSRLCGLCWYKKPGPVTRPFPTVLLITRGGHHASPRHQQSAPSPQVWPCDNAPDKCQHVTPARIQREKLTGRSFAFWIKFEWERQVWPPCQSGCIWLNNLFVKSSFAPQIMPLLIAGFPLFCPWPPLKGCWGIIIAISTPFAIISADTLLHKSMLPRLFRLPPISPIRGFFTLLRPNWIISPS